MEKLYTLRIIQVVDFKRLFSFCRSLVGQNRCSGFLINFIIFVTRKFRYYCIDLVIKTGRFFGRTGYDKGCSCLINQYAVHLIHYRKVEFPLDN